MLDTVAQVGILLLGVCAVWLVGCGRTGGPPMQPDEDRQRWEQGDYCPGWRDVLASWRTWLALLGVLWVCGGF